ncbi:hypothetical protein AB0L26_33465 [Streptomyces nondiastaticus]
MREIHPADGMAANYLASGPRFGLTNVPYALHKLDQIPDLHE